MVGLQNSFYLMFWFGHRAFTNILRPIYAQNVYTLMSILYALGFEVKK